jgi:hypothetical protein
MDEKRGTVPVGVLLISINYTFGAIMLLAFLFINPTQISSMIADRHGLPTFTGPWILPAVACLALMIAYGLYSLSKWGYALTIGYLLYFGWINRVLYIEQASWTYLGSIIWPSLVIFYLFLIRKRFFEKKVVRKTGRNAQTA